MKILYIVHARVSDEYSGTPLIAEQYAKECKNLGWEACILTPSFDNIDFKNQKPEVISNILHISWPAIKNWTLDAFLNNKNRDYKKLQIPFSPDVVHILDWVNMCPSIFTLLKKINVPIIKHVYNFEDFCYFISPIYRKEDNRYCDAPLTSKECCECINDNNFSKLKLLKKIKYLLFTNKKKLKREINAKLKNRNHVIQDQAQNYYDHLIFPSDSFAKYYFSHLGINKKHSIIPNGINIISEKIDKKKSSSLNFIYTGGVSLRKGWKIIESVFYQICSENKYKIKLRIYGDKNKTKKSKLNKFSNIEFFDSFHPKEIDDIMKWADVGIAPSFFETYSRIVREYINYNIVPISTNAFGVPDIIKNNKNGIIIEKPYTENLLKTLEKILKDPYILDNLRKNMNRSEIMSKSEEFKKISNIYKKSVKN